MRCPKFPGRNFQWGRGVLEATLKLQQLTFRLILLFRFFDFYALLEIILKQEKKYVDLHIFMVARTNCGRLNSVNKPAVKHRLCRTDHVLISNLKNS